MKIRGELLKIQASPYDEKGEKLEPEELPAERILLTETRIKGSIDQELHDPIRTSVNVQSTVGKFANGLRTMCAQCKHFDGEGWLKRKAILERSGAEGTIFLNGMRSALIQQGLGPASGMHATPDEDIDLEHAISFMGYCKALCEHLKDEILVHPMSGCPKEVCTPSQPNGFFENTNLDSQRIGDAAYDSVMNKAVIK